MFASGPEALPQRNRCGLTASFFLQGQLLYLSPNSVYIKDLKECTICKISLDKPYRGGKGFQESTARGLQWDSRVGTFLLLSKVCTLTSALVQLLQVR